jgi:uncharacterized OsmC-like protein
MCNLKRRDARCTDNLDRHRVKFKVKGDLDEATIRELLDKSPVYDTLANPVKIKIEVEKV